MQQVEDGLDKLEREVGDLSNVAADVTAAVTDLRGTVANVQASREELRSATQELHTIPYMAKPDLLMTTDEQGRPAIGYSRGSRLDSGYASFEDVFRGPSSMIRERLEPYVALVAGHEPVVEIGSGRGEFLDLMRRTGIAATGVDIDPSMIERSRSQGHDVLEQDGVNYIERQDPATLGAIFSAQVVEHLSEEQLRHLLDGAYQALKPSGLLILETVNPHSVAAFKAFWTDLTHRVPIFPEVLVVLCRAAGFGECRVLFPNGDGDLSTDRWTQGEYAVIARK
jgi:SAM-dependent methyltransferase